MKMRTIFLVTLMMTGCVDPSISALAAEARKEVVPSQGIAVELNPAQETGSADDRPPATRPEVGPSAPATDAGLETMGLSPALEGVVKLLRAGVEEEVLLKHIAHSAEPFKVGSDEILFLTDLGASGAVISAMIERDQHLQSASGPSAEAQSREPWPPAGTVAEVPASESATAASEAQTVTAEAPTTEVTVEYFHDYLAPYGTWIDVAGYGLCWQPTVTVSCPGWIPYGDRGRWVYTDCGWYWYSDYTWGWTVFHYGRWFHHTRWGWCWVPGTVWGPSWVSWRYADPYCGWAPLPPYSSGGFYLSVGISWGIPAWCYTYVPSHRICAPAPRECAMPYHQAREIHHRSEARNHYAVGRNHTIENRGIPPEELTRNPGSDVRHAAINPRHEIPTGRVRSERLDPVNGTLTVHQPRVTRAGLNQPDRVPGIKPAAAHPRTLDPTLSNRRNVPASTTITPRTDFHRSPHEGNGVSRTSPTSSRRTPPEIQRPIEARDPSAPTSPRVAPTGDAPRSTPTLNRPESRGTERSVPGSAPTRSRLSPPVGSSERGFTGHPDKPDNSPVITGRQPSPRTAATAPASPGLAPPRAAPPVNTSLRSDPKLPVRPVTTPPAGSESSTASRPGRTWAAPASRAEPRPAIPEPPPRTVAPPTVSRTSPFTPARPPTPPTQVHTPTAPAPAYTPTPPARTEPTSSPPGNSRSAPAGRPERARGSRER
ncbi:MAG: hypothetical protein MUE94_12525 [Verrucomicrobia bacterium]|jgi:hypothetical protein|nr:hypothetical protein [Verrucomicrobiota bacterium]